MKQLALLTLVLLSFISLCAQEKNDSRTTNSILFKQVSPTWDLKDRILVDNRSAYLVEQVVVAEVIDHDLRPLGSCNNVEPMGKCEVATFERNGLRRLKGRTIAIKAKGLKRAGDGKNITDEYTYDFEARVYEYKHDLYIELYTTSGPGFMDF